MKSPNKVLTFLLSFVLGLTVAFCLWGCTTVRPAKTEAAQPSFDAQSQTNDSGFLGWTNGGAIITGHARDRYNALIAKYGSRFLPPIKKDTGIQPAGGDWRIDSAALENFGTMNRWRVEGK